MLTQRKRAYRRARSAHQPLVTHYMCVYVCFSGNLIVKR